MRLDNKKTHRRGAGLNPEGRFESQRYEDYYDGWEIPEDITYLTTEVREEIAKKILTKNDSPDIPFTTSINPYRGCEHGCIYCYARPNHSYVNLSPGLDFETKIFAKTNASEILEQEFSSKSYNPTVIALGASTDPYQPTERRLGITRKILETCLRWRNPIGIVTKSSLVTRDIDILSELAKLSLVRVYISITTLDNRLASVMEPRAASPVKRFEAVEKLSSAGISVGVMSAPLIPFLNDHEMESILEAAKNSGAKSCGYTFIRLPYEVKDLFKDWLEKNFPLKKEHIMSLIKISRNGEEYSAEWGERMTGTGNYAMLIKSRFRNAVKKLSLNMPEVRLRTDLFRRIQDRDGQLKLF